MKIEVTQEDIDKGARKNHNGFYCLGCPVARAMKRALGVEYYVGYAHTHTYSGPLIDLPDTVRVFVRKYDHNPASVQPFTFDLDLPATTLSREGKGE